MKQNMQEKVSVFLVWMDGKIRKSIPRASCSKAVTQQSSSSPCCTTPSGWISHPQQEHMKNNYILTYATRFSASTFGIEKLSYTPYKTGRVQ